MAYFAFHQNNSGGSFVRDDNVAEVVIIEAKNADEANLRAEEVGIYFDGCDKDWDCPCCGDRWYRQWGDEGSEVPSVYGQTDLHAYVNGEDNWFDKCVYVYHANGNKDVVVPG
jgi:hypothetical protein